MHRRTTCLLALLIIASAHAGPPRKEKIEKAAMGFLDGFKVKERERPDWAAKLGTANFRVAVLADVHLGRRGPARLQKALAKVKELKPDFAIFLGDNVNDAVASEHARFKRIVDAGIGCPWHVIKGDNDARDYTKVFGSTHWSFVYGGVHFLGTGLDIDVEGKGIGRFAERTFSWLKGRLEHHRELPTLVFQHEPAMPPSFLHAPRFTGFISRYPQVRAVLHGHLHRDFEMSGRGRKWFTLPAVGPNPRHGFKMLHFHDEQLVLRTWEDLGQGYMLSQKKWQRALWGKHRPLKKAPRQLSQRVASEPVETVFDPALGKQWAIVERLIRGPRKKK